jgi:P27 family predicted phage terminase small subunit
MKGRKPKDVALKLLAGNPGHRPLPSNQEPFTRGELVKPEGLDVWASQEWDRLVESLSPILSPASAGMLRVAISAFSELMVADALIQQHGLTYATGGESGPLIRLHPAVRARSAARQSYHRALAELGASPVAHTRVKKLPDNEQIELPGIAKLLG